MPSPVAEVVGYTELLASIRLQPAVTRKAILGELRKAGTLVETDAATRITELHPPSMKSAAGFRTVVRAGGVVVEQALRKTTGRRPDWGMNQMKYGLYPAVDENLDDIIAGVEEAMVKATALIGISIG